jgi:hypothetical protein
MAQDDDPHAPYKVYEGDELKGTYATRAEARRAQQRLESQAAGAEPPCRFVIKDNHDRVVI